MVGPVGWWLNFNWGWRSKIDYAGDWRLFMLTVEDCLCWQLKTLEVDDSSRGHELRTYVDRLSSIYEACHVSLFDWILYRIEASLRLPCISHIYNTLLLPHFYTFQPKTYCQSAIVNPVRALRRTSVPVNYTTVNFSLLRERWVLLLLFFPSLAFCAYILLDLHTRQSLLDPSVLGFVVDCRQCLLRQVISQ